MSDNEDKTTNTDDSDRCLTPMWIIDGLRKFAPGRMYDYCTEEDNPCGADQWRFLGSEGTVGEYHQEGGYLGPSDFTWCNPPYSRGGKMLAIDAIKDSIEFCNPGAKWAVLVPADHATEVCAKLETYATHMGFFDKRIKFDTSRGGFRGKPTTARFSNVLYTNFAYDIPGIRCYAVRRAEGDVHGR